MKKIFLLILISFIFTFQALAFQAQVIKVYDGDTILITDKLNETKQKVRFYGIDAPELTQKFGIEAKLFLNNYINNKIITIEKKGIDKYNRIIGIIYLNDLCLNELMISNGFAMVDTRFCRSSICKKWNTLQIHAENQKTGMWIIDNPIPP